MLKNKVIDFVQVELSMNPENTYHNSFLKTKMFIEELGYYIFGFYDQMPERHLGFPYLRRANAVFVSKFLKKRQK